MATVMTKSPHHYEGRAEEVRLIAEDTRDPWCRNALLGAAEDLDEMARQVRRIAAGRYRLGERFQSIGNEGAG